MRVGILAIALVPRVASAEPLARAEIDLGPPLGRIAFTVEGAAGADLRLTAGTKSLPLGNAPAGRLAATIEPVLLADGENLAHVTVRGDSLAREALVGADLRGQLATLWQETTGLRGDPGERSGQVLLLDDWTDDGKPDPVVAWRAERVRLCGSDRALLKPRVFFPAKRAFVFGSLNRFRGRQPTAIQGTTSSPGPTAAPLLAVATWTTSSIVRTDGGAVDVSSPTAIADGDLSTAWPVEANREFATAEVTAPIGLRAIAVVPDRARRPRQIVVSTETGLFEATVPPDAPKVWIAFPEPQRTSCLSITFASAAVADVAVYTDLDFGAGLDALVADLGSEERADAAMRVLEQVGARALGPLEAGVASESPVVRRRTALVLGRIADAAAAAKLVELLADSDRDVREQTVRALVGMRATARPALAAALAGEAGRTRAGAALVLGQWADMDGLAILVPEAGRGGTEDRTAIRVAIHACLVGTGDAGLALVRSRLESDPAPAAVLDLVRALDLEGTAARAVARTHIETLLGAADFPTRWHAVRLAGNLCARDDALHDQLRAMRGDDDEILRAEVMRSVGRCRGDVADDLAEPLGDPTPRVRQAAAEALVGRGKVPRRELRRVFTADRWPMVRAAAVLALASDPGALADEDLVRALRDHSSLVRRAGVNAIGTVRRRSVWRPLVERMEDAQEDALVRAESATALGTVCAQHSAEALTERVRAAVRPMSDPDQRVGAAAIASLVRLGGQRRRQARAFADLPSTPDYLRAAVRVALREPECRDAWRGSGQ